MSAPSGNITSIRSGTQRNMLKFGITKRTQLIQLWMTIQYDFERFEDILSLTPYSKLIKVLISSSSKNHLGQQLEPFPITQTGIPLLKKQV